MGITNKIQGIAVPWHFDTRFFSYQGEEWEIIGAKNGSDKTLDKTIYTIRRLSDRYMKEAIHKDLMAALLNEKRYKERTIAPKQKAQ